MIGFGMPGMTEWVVILVIVLIFFGAGKLPSVFAQAGKGIKAFRDASEGRPKDGESEGAEPSKQSAPRKQLAGDTSPSDPDDLDDGPERAGTAAALGSRKKHEA